MTSARVPVVSPDRTSVRAPGQEAARGDRLVASSADQAQALRVMAARRRPTEPVRRLGGAARVLAVASGKGGVGKTNVAVNLAVTFAKQGYQVVVLDCDLGLANVDALLGLHPKFTLQHVLTRQRRLEEVVLEGPAGVRIVPGASGLSELADLSDAQRDDLMTRLGGIDGMADIVILDTGAGISANVLQFVVAAGDVLVVTTPEPTAITDAYALIKVVTSRVAQTRGESPMRMRLVVNQTMNDAEARETATNIVTVAKRFLDVDIEALGGIPADPAVLRAVRSQGPFTLLTPRAPASQAVERLAMRILGDSSYEDGEASGMNDRGRMSASSSERVTVARPVVTSTDIPRTVTSSGATRSVSATPRSGIGGFVQRLFGLGRGS
jgi:flagellar biosynthesis protein FlhG